MTWLNTRVAAIYKSGNTTNYRPICSIPITLKIIEKALVKLLSSSSAQFSFRKKLSFDLAAATLSENILLNRDSGLFTGAVLLDEKESF